MQSYLVAGESHDDLAQIGQGAVDVLGFLQTLAGAFRVLQPLGAGEVDQIKGARAGLASNRVVPRDLEHKDRVRPRRPLVAIGGCH